MRRGPFRKDGADQHIAGGRTRADDGSMYRPISYEKHRFSDPVSETGDNRVTGQAARQCRPSGPVRAHGTRVLGPAPTHTCCRPVAK